MIRRMLLVLALLLALACPALAEEAAETAAEASLLQKGVNYDPRLMPAYRALWMATRAGAFAQGRENQIGQLTAGFDASLILVDTEKPGLYEALNIATIWLDRMLAEK